MVIRTSKWVCCLILLVGLFSARLSWADILPGDDPAVLHIGNGVGGDTISTYNSGCATGGCYLYSPSGSGNPSEVNGFTNTVDIYMNSGGAKAQTSPVLLILGVPNDTTGTQLDVSAIQSVDLYHKNNSTLTITKNVPFTFGDPNNTFHATGGTSGYQGSFTTGGFTPVGGNFKTYKGQPDVYEVLNLTGNGSNNFVNWAGADLQINGINATNFGIYVFAIQTNRFDSWDALNMTFAKDVPVGTMIVAYGQYPNAQTAGDAFTTPFTESGIRTRKIPEPGTLSIIGFGLLTIGLLRYRFSVGD